MPRDEYSELHVAALVALGTMALASCAPDQIPPVDAPASAWAEACEDWDDWDKPAPAFRLHGSTYHVGTCGISAILIAGAGEDGGHILIDSGTQGGAQIVLDNIRSLGFDPADISTVLMSHEHFDHVGGFAVIQGQTDARFLASAAAAQVLRSGESDPDDPQFGLLEDLTPSRIDGLVKDGEVIGSGASNLTGHATPGHTLGAFSWQWQSCADGECVSVVYADSLSPAASNDFRFSGLPEYVQSYRDGLALVAALDCNILLSPHPSASGMRDKIVANDLTTGINCAQYAADAGTRLDARLAQEAEGTL